MKEDLFQKFEDKFFELHTHLHNIEIHYHDSLIFRTHYNSFLNTYKSIIKQIDFSLQNNKHFNDFKNLKNKYFENSIIKETLKRRDIINHKKDLKLDSSSFMCLIKNKKTYDIKIKLFISKSLMDSDELIVKILQNNDFYYQIFMKDEDYYLAIYRDWKIKNNCILNEIRELLSIMGNFIHDLYILLGFCNNKINFVLDCLPLINNIKYKFYDRDKFKKFI